MDSDNFAIRPIDTGDAVNYFLFVSKNACRIGKFFPNTAAVNKDVGSTNIFIEDTIRRWERKEFNCFVIYDKKSRNIVGAVFLKNFDWNARKCELSYFIDSDFEHKGITTKAVAGVIRHCFSELNLNKVFMRIAETNIASRRVAEKNGFAVEGILRQDFRTADGEWVDLAYYGLLSHTWRND